MRKTEIDPVARLRAVVAEEGSQKGAALYLHCAESYVGDLLKGRRPFSEAMLASLGLRRIVVEVTK